MKLTNKTFILVLSFATLSSCSVRKHKKVSSMQSSELATSSNFEQKKTIKQTSSKTIVRDTILKVETRFVRDSIFADVLKPIRTDEGKLLPKKTRISGRGVSVELTALPSGQIAVEGNCDSIEVLVKGLITENVKDTETLDSLYKAVADLKSSNQQTIEMEKKSSSLLPWWGWAALTIAGCLFLIYLFNKSKNPFK